MTFSTSSAWMIAFGGNSLIIFGVPMLLTWLIVVILKYVKASSL